MQESLNNIITKQVDSIKQTREKVQQVIEDQKRKRDEKTSGTDSTFLTSIS